MKMRVAAVLCLLAMVLGSSGASRPARPAVEGADERQKQEDFLRQGRVISVDKSQLGGRTNPWLVTLDDGKSRGRAVFRYVDRPRPHPRPDSYKYDLAAYELTKLLGVEIVPPAVSREIEGRRGALQIYLENCLREKDRRRQKLEPPDPRTFALAKEGIRVFENLTYDECQDFDDLWIHKDNWRVCRVDFSEAFSPSLELLEGCEVTVCSRAMYEGLGKWNDDSARASLKPYLSDEECRALFVRRNRVLETIKKRISEKGEEAVLF